MTNKMIIKFDRRFKNDKYELLFNTETGLEVLQGINGYPDPFKLDLPSLLDVGVMGHCKNKCPFCYQGPIKQPHMKLSDFMSIIDQTHHHTNQIALGGRGDPNKHPDFAKMLEYCRKHNVVPNYTTSGIDLTDDEIETSKMCGAVAVSDYEQPHTYKALKGFMNAGIKTNIHQLFHKGTYSKCLQIVYGYDPWKYNGNKAYYHEHPGEVDIDKLNAVIFLLFKPQGSGRTLTDLIPTKYQLKTFGIKILQPDSKFKVGMDSCLVNHVLQYTETTPVQAMSIDTCEAARMSGYITPDMKFKPCSFAEKTSEVDLARTNIENIWNTSRVFKGFRKHLIKNKMSCPIGF